MSFCAQKIILTSVEPDHQDYYPTYESIRDAFVEYICKLPPGEDLIYCTDDKGATETAEIVKSKRSDINFIPYGTTASGDFHLTLKSVQNEKNIFELDLFKNSSALSDVSDFKLSVPGRHEVLDAAAAVALVCRLLEKNNLSPKDYYNQIALGLMNFTGGKRRSEIAGRFVSKSGNSVIVIDDYGHHPTAIKTTLEGYREFYKGRKIIVDFMSHTYSRTQALLNEFSESLVCADEIILHKIYSSARENPSDFEITGKTLYEQVLKTGKSKDCVHYFEEVLDAKDFVIQLLNRPLSDKFPDGYLFVTMGAGDNWKLGKAVLNDYL